MAVAPPSPRRSAGEHVSGCGTEAPIGVFDSGIGGLTVVGELHRRLPYESVVYVGDTARVPYGPKSPETVLRYSREIAGFLVSRGVKAVVIACNTATAHALPALQAELPVPVMGVVQPGARAALAATRSGVVGVVGTVGTVRSGAYERAIHALSPATRVLSRACPLFVPLVEEGWLHHEATRIVAHEYMAPLAQAGVDTLVLGCTHYPLLVPLLGEVLGPDVALIDSARETALELASLLEREGLANPGVHPAVHSYLATDDQQRMLELGQRFLGLPMDGVEALALG